MLNTVKDRGGGGRGERRDTVTDCLPGKGQGTVPTHSFEVKVLSGKRWMVDRVFDSETLALKHAKDLVKGNQYNGVKVDKERLKADGTFTGSTIFKQMCDGPGDAPVSIVPIDDASDCQSVEDVYGIDARLTMWKVLRKYFDQVGLTPSEVLHNYNALSKLMDNDPPVYPAAIDRISSIQARKHGLDGKERRDELYQWADIVASRAREAQREKYLRKFSLADYPALLEAAFEEGGPARRDHLVRCVIAQHFYTERNFMAKLDVLLKAATPDLAREDLDILDGFIADVLGSATVIQELLGTRTNLCHALIGLIDLMEGKEETDGRQDPEILTVLRRMFAEGRLPGGASVLLERIRSQIEGRQPLNRNDPEREGEAFERLLGRLSTSKGISGGPAMAEALTARCGLRFQEGGAVGRRKAVGTMIGLIRDPVQKIRYLLSIAETETGTQAMDVIAETISAITDRATDIHGFVHPGLSATRKMMTISEVQRAILASRLPEGARDALFDRLDELLEDYVARDGFIDRLDDPDLALRERAQRLVKFCSSGILIEGRALALARRRIAEHLRQPNFIERFTEGCESPAEAETAVRAFHKQLAEAGFSG